MAAKETEFSKVRFGDNAKAAKVDSLGVMGGLFLNIFDRNDSTDNWHGQVYENIVPLVAEDIADQIIYVTTRPRFTWQTICQMNIHASRNFAWLGAEAESSYMLVFNLNLVDAVCLAEKVWDTEKPFKVQQLQGMSKSLTLFHMLQTRLGWTGMSSDCWFYWWALKSLDFELIPYF